MTDFSKFVRKTFVSVPGGPRKNEGFYVRGLAMEDVSKILQVHGAALNALYLERVVASGGSMETASIAALGMAALETVPEAAIAAIAMAADAEDQYGDIRRLPLPVQAAALEALLALTFHTEEDLGNFVGAVLRGSESVQKVLSLVLRTETSTVGSEESENPSAFSFPPATAMPPGTR